MTRWLAICVLLGASVVLAQNSAAPAPSAGAGTFTISGTVVNAASGAPLHGATVTLSTTGENGTELADALTGDDGRFRFDSLLAGKYAVQAAHRGYIMGGYEDHGGYFTAIVTGPDLDSQGIRLAIMPFGAIDGIISEDGGGPVAGAQVTLFRQDDFQGEGKIVSAGETVTDDSGSYEFSELRPGAYFIDVSATPWYSFQTQPIMDEHGNPSPDTQPASPLDVAYPLTFYPNATDSSSATPIPLSAGDRAQINFSMHAVPAVHIHLRLPMPANPRRGFVTPQLMRSVFGEETPVQSLNVGNVAFDKSTNTMNVFYKAVAPGNYTLGEGAANGMPLDADGDRTIDIPATAAGVDVTGKFAALSGTPLPDGLIVWLHSPNGLPEMFTARLQRDGTFAFHGVAPGTYEVLLGGNSGTPVVVQMAATGADVKGNKITVGSDPVLLAATISSGSVTLNGFAKRGGKGLGGTMIVLVPADPNAGVDLFRRDQSDSDGSFTLPGVIPGSYTLVSIDNGWGLEWAVHDVIGRYLAHGLKVQVPENLKTMNLTDAVPVQDR